MWNKIKAAIKAAKDVVVKAFRWLTGGAVKGIGYGVMGGSTVIAIVLSVRLAVLLMVAKTAILGGAALVDVGNIIAGDKPVQIGKTYDLFMGDTDEADEEELNKFVVVPKGLNHDVHDVGVVSYTDGKVFIKESEAQKKEPVQAPFFADIRKALAEKGIEAKDTDFQPAIGGTGYLDRCDAKHLDPWTFGHDEEGRDYVVTPWMCVIDGLRDLENLTRYGRVIIFQRYPSSNVIVQGRLEGYNAPLDLPYSGQGPFLTGIANGKWTLFGGVLTFVNTAPELDKFNRAI